ncbi:MAG: UvrD-helicase domain-containing protein [bacterium]|nr:UvrD-helicase domain-containing protein [bacterium]
MDLLEHLNDRQKEAVQTTEGPLLILAGAGTGKTMALTYRIAYLIQEKKVDPRQILAVTFTNKAAGEMKERVEKLLLDSDVLSSGLPTMGTFHSICVQILRREIQHLGYETSFVIYDSDDSLALVKRVMKELQISEKSFNPKAIRGAISAAKNVLQTVEDLERSAMNTFQQKVALVYEHYQKALLRSASLDFDDLIMKTVELFEQHETILQKYQYRWKYLHVDEYQDTNTAQYRLIQLLAQAYRNLCVVGDPDQNIYSWRGADITNILQFEREYQEAKVVKLEQNYRSTPHILSGAEAVIAHNKGRIEKQLWTELTEGEKVQMVDVDDERAEADYVLQQVSRSLGHLNEHAVLYRTNAQSRVMEEACLRYGIPYKVIGGVRFYARKEIKDMVGYLRLIHNARDDASLIRIINTPSRKIGAKTLESALRVAVRQGFSLFQVMAAGSDLLLTELPESKYAQLQRFARLIEGLQVFSREFPVSTLIREILYRTGYDKMLLEEKEVGQTRLENVEELISVAKKYDELELGVGLSTFLEEVALVSDTDELQGSEDYLTLMTIHSSKGLEFKHVYLIGLEEGVFPHSRAAFDPEQMEEERRLMYVGMTRAREFLHLIWARRRMLFGETQYNPPSSFLKHLPPECADGEYLAQQGEVEMVGRLREVGREEKIVFSDEIPGFMQQLSGSKGFGSSASAFIEGDELEHKVFGRGIIRTLKGDIADVEFEHYGMKKIALNVAPVRKV